MIVVQLSDSHLCASGQLYAALPSTLSMAKAPIAEVSRLNSQPVLVVVSGDHDECGTLRAAFTDHAYLTTAGPINTAEPLRYCIAKVALRSDGMIACFR